MAAFPLERCSWSNGLEASRIASTDMSIRERHELDRRRNGRCPAASRVFERDAGGVWSAACPRHRAARQRTSFLVRSVSSDASSCVPASVVGHYLLERCNAFVARAVDQDGAADDGFQEHRRDRGRQPRPNSSGTDGVAAADGMAGRLEGGHVEPLERVRVAVASCCERAELGSRVSKSALQGRARPVGMGRARTPMRGSTGSARAAFAFWAPSE